MGTNRRRRLRASVSARRQPTRRSPSRWGRWPEDAWVPVDRAFWTQPPETILAALLRDPVDPARLDDFRGILAGAPHFPHLFADRAGRAPRPLVLRRVHEAYVATRGTYQQIRAAWRAQLPRRRALAPVRKAASDALDAALRQAFPGMPDSRRAQIVKGTVERKTSEVTDALRAHVGARLNWGSSHVHKAVTRAGRLGPHGLDADAEKGLLRFRAWIAVTRPAFHADAVEGLRFILAARELAAPRPEFYTEGAPLYFQLASFARRNKPDPRAERGAAAVLAWSRGDDVTWRLWAGVSV
jgi:hypothetical protein